MYLAIGIVAWVVCSVLAYGVLVHEYKQECFSYHPFDLKWRLLVVFGPVSLFGILMVHEHKVGLDFKPYTRDERWKIFNKVYNSDGYVYKTREQFDEEY